MRKAALILALLVVGADAWLLFSGNRLLVHESYIEPGQDTGIAGYGPSSTQAQLVCTFFTGRSFRKTVFWYSSNNILGRDECPFVAAP